MTNREKAQAISEVFKSEVLQAGAFLGSLEMAEWKDQQFKEYLEKKKEESNIDLDPASELIYEIINELFGE